MKPKDERLKELGVAMDKYENAVLLLTEVAIILDPNLKVPPESVAVSTCPKDTKVKLLKAIGEAFVEKEK